MIFHFLHPGLPPQTRLCDRKGVVWGPNPCHRTTRHSRLSRRVWFTPLCSQSFHTEDSLSPQHRKQQSQVQATHSGVRVCSNLYKIESNCFYNGFCSSCKILFSSVYSRPFSVTPSSGTLDVGESMQVTVDFHPMTIGNHSQDLLLHYHTGEN